MQCLKKQALDQAGRPLWIADAEVARMLNVHRTTVWRWREQELIPPPRRVGGRTFWSRLDIELFAGCRSMSEFRRLKARQT
jgi:predicted DNA-binding transcriptional regulator AlpA